MPTRLPFVNLADVEFTDVQDNGYGTSKRARCSAAIGACKLRRAETGVDHHACKVSDQPPAGGT